MKSARVKKIIFAVLLCTAGYIWWGNLRFLKSSSAQEGPVQQAAVTEAVGASGKQSEIAYIEPKVNPFIRESKSEVPQPARPPASRTERAGSMSTAPAPSARCTLKGLVRESETPQAVIVFEDQTSAVLSMKDSLGSWQLVAIKDSLIVFKLEKAYDTLWLDGRRP